MPAPRGPFEPAGGCPRDPVLVVEDEAPLAEVIGKVLNEEGYEVLVASSGEEGLEVALGKQLLAVILDLGLPGMDGMQVCREMRAHGLTVPVIMLTARDTVPDRVRGLDAGADDYLVKPFALEELLARLRAQMRREDRGSGGILQVADLALEIDTMLVRRAQRDVQLTLQEFKLLELLMRHPNQVLSRETILERVWDRGAEPASNVVDIYIHYLRDKIDRDHPHKLIETVRSIGYVLRP
jgi:DNA-binding response OmpR family regulator